VYTVPRGSIGTTKTKTKTQDRHPFAELLTQYRQRKPGLTQTHLAELAGYDQAILVRMCQGKKDLTGSSGHERIPARTSPGSSDPAR
jgi:hypothetical protein